MIRLPLVLAALLTLSLNGSLAAAADVPPQSHACQPGAVCTLPLRMLSPPPPRPEGLALRAAVVIPATGQR